MFLINTDAIGASLGNWTSTLVVEASSRSVGTWNVSVVYAPATAVGGATLTCADAGSAKAITPVRAAPSTAAPRVVRDMLILSKGIAHEKRALGTRNR